MSYAIGSAQLRRRLSVGGVDVLGVNVSIDPQDWKRAKEIEARFSSEMASTRRELHEAAGRIAGAGRWVAGAFVGTAIAEVLLLSRKGRS